jgi:hypothetical protein
MGLDAGYGIGSLKPGVCTSSTRPASPYEGQAIYETDTDKVLVWNGTAWYANWNTAWGVVALTSSTTNSATITSEAVTLTSPSFTAVAGRYYRITYYEPVVQSTGSPVYLIFRIRLTNISGTILQRADTESTGTDGQFVPLQIVTTLTAGATTICGTAAAASGSILLYGNAGVSVNRQIIVEDIGPA